MSDGQESDFDLHTVASWSTQKCTWTCIRVYILILLHWAFCFRRVMYFSSPLLSVLFTQKPGTTIKNAAVTFGDNRWVIATARRHAVARHLGTRKKQKKTVLVPRAPLCVTSVLPQHYAFTTLHDTSQQKYCTLTTVRIHPRVCNRVSHDSLCSCTAFSLTYLAFPFRLRSSSVPH